MPDLPRRRTLLAASLALLRRVPPAGAATATPFFPDGAAMLVAGPAGGPLDRCADLLIPALARTLPGGQPLDRRAEGGPDGVTGCNQFEARVAPDGATSLLLPGDAPLAWLVGDPRAKFDVARFIPLLAGVASAMLISRRPLASVTPAAPLRLAAARPDSPDLAALLALDLLGVPVQPVLGLADKAAQTALETRAVDALLLIGRPPATPIAGGASAVLSLGLPGEDGIPQRDPACPDTPVFDEAYAARFGSPPTGARHAAWRAVAVAAQLRFLLALQTPTPAAMVALWRQSAGQAGAGLVQAGGMAGLRLLPCPGLNLFAAPLAADPSALLELRRWLAERHHWQPA